MTATNTIEPHLFSGAETPEIIATFLGKKIHLSLVPYHVHEGHEYTHDHEKFHVFDFWVFSVKMEYKADIVIIGNARSLLPHDEQDNVISEAPRIELEYFGKSREWRGVIKDKNGGVKKRVMPINPSFREGL